MNIRPVHFIGITILLALLSCQSLNQEDLSSKNKAPNKHLTLANNYARDGLFREAIQSYLKALKETPKNNFIHRNLGMVYVKIGDYGRAANHLELSLDSYQNNFEANFYLAEAYRARGQFGKAIYRYNRALEESPKSIKTLKALAWSYFKSNFSSEALTVLKTLSELAPNDPQVIIILARTHLKLGNPQKALSLIRRGQALTHKSNLPFLQSVEGDIYFKLGDIKKAEELYRLALKDQPLLAGALLGLGKTLIRNKQNIELAIEYIDRAARIRPRMTEALYILGKYYEKTDQSKSNKYFASYKKYAGKLPEDALEELDIGKGNKSKTQQNITNDPVSPPQSDTEKIL